MTVMAFAFNAALWSGDITHAQRLPAGDRVQTLIATSLFTDKRARLEELPEGTSDRRGCWSDQFQLQPRGSLLWTLRREKLTPNTLGKARAFALDALQWMVGREVKSIDDVVVTRSGPQKGHMRVLYQPLRGAQQAVELQLSIGDLL